MKRVASVGAVAFLGLLALASASWAQQAEGTSRADRFRFKFEANRPLVYSMRVAMKMVMDIKAGTEAVTTKTAFELRHHLKLTPAGEPKGDITTMRLELAEIEGDWDITNPGGRVLVTLRGSQVKATRDGTVIIDTANDVGSAQAQEFKKGLTPLYLTGQVELDSRGNVRKFSGDPPFVEHWTEASAAQVGFWGVVFPDRAIPVGESWKETLRLKKMGQVKLEGEGMDCTVTFTRQPDRVVRGKQLAVFQVSAPFSHKDPVSYTHLTLPTIYSV